MKKKLLVATTLFCLLLSACGKKTETAQTPEQTTTVNELTDDERNDDQIERDEAVTDARDQYDYADRSEDVVESEEFPDKDPIPAETLQFANGVVFDYEDFNDAYMGAAWELDEDFYANNGNIHRVVFENNYDTELASKVKFECKKDTIEKQDSLELIHGSLQSYYDENKPNNLTKDHDGIKYFYEIENYTMYVTESPYSYSVIVYPNKLDANNDYMFHAVIYKSKNCNKEMFDIFMNTLEKYYPGFEKMPFDRYITHEEFAR